MRRSQWLTIANVIATIFFSTCVANSIAKSETLNIPPRQQLTQVWCWLGVGEMIHRHYDIPTVNPAGIYQCGIIGALAHGTSYHACSMSCGACTFPAGSWQNVKWMLEEYPKKVRLYTGSNNKGVRAEHFSDPLTKSDIVDEIDDDNPVVAGISPSGRPPGANFTSQHVALIIGYENDGDTLIVNDPYPFPSGVWQNPYLAAGAVQLQPLRYSISYTAFKNQLNWAESFTVRSVTLSGGAASYPNYCCTPAGKLGPYSNPGVPVGGTCYGTHPVYGPLVGMACP